MVKIHKRHHAVFANYSIPQYINWKAQHLNGMTHFNLAIHARLSGPPKARTARRGTDIALKNKVDYDGVEYEEEDLGLP